MAPALEHSSNAGNHLRRAQSAHKPKRERPRENRTDPFIHSHAVRAAYSAFPASPDSRQGKKQAPRQDARAQGSHFVRWRDDEERKKELRRRGSRLAQAQRPNILCTQHSVPLLHHRQRESRASYDDRSGVDSFDAASIDDMSFATSRSEADNSKSCNVQTTAASATSFSRESPAQSQGYPLYRREQPLCGDASESSKLGETPFPYDFGHQAGVAVAGLNGAGRVQVGNFQTTIQDISFPPEQPIDRVYREFHSRQIQAEPRHQCGPDSFAPPSPKLGERVHGFSRSLRKKFSETFLGKPEKAKVPLQQVQSNRSHFGSIRGSRAPTPSPMTNDIYHGDYERSSLIENAPPPPPSHRDTSLMSKASMYFVRSGDREGGGTSLGSGKTTFRPTSNSRTCSKASVPTSQAPVAHSRVSSWTDNSDAQTVDFQDFPAPPLDPISESSPERHVPLRKASKSTINSAVIPERVSSLKSGMRKVDGRKVFTAVIRRMSTRSRSNRYTSHPTQLHQNASDSVDTNDDDDVLEPQQPAIKSIRIVSTSGRTSSTSHSRQGSRERRCIATTETHENLQSPSVYSLDRDEGTIAGKVHPSSGSDQMPNGTATIHMSRYASRFSLRDHNPERPVQSSGDWRQWATGQTAGIESPSDMQVDLLDRKNYASTGMIRKRSGHIRGHTQIVDDREDSVETLSTHRKASYTSLAPDKPRRETPMNERFPMLLPARNTSSQSLASRHSSHSTATQLLACRQKASEAAPRRSSGRISHMQSMPEVSRNAIGVRAHTLSRLKETNASTTSRENMRPQPGRLQSSPSKVASPVGSPMDDIWLKRIRRGPYQDSPSPRPATPSPLRPHQRQVRLSPTRQTLRRHDENTPPARKDEMVQQFLEKSRASFSSAGYSRENSPAFI